ncbi:MAG: regulatory protein RecX [Actinomycetaceae bacterium]|nr:regulatory protein RecX [Actinomycetaceae bacterium]
MVSFYDPDEVTAKKRVDRKAALERRQKRREWAASLTGDAAVSAAKEAALKQLDRQDRSRGELTAKLRERGFNDEPIAAALDRLEEAGLVNDERYARMLVRTRHAERGLVGRALVEQLRRKQIPSEIIELAMEEVEGESMEDLARDIVQRKAGGMLGLSRDKQIRRLTSMLARKGYPPGVCYSVVNSVLSELEDDEY